MTSLAVPLPDARPVRLPRAPIERFILAGAVPLVALFAAALLRWLAAGLPLPPRHSVWLAIHLAAVLPAVPLGGYLLWVRKGDRAHRLLGRVWAVLMLVTALSSFGLRASGHLSWIHGLALVTLVSVPWAVVQAATGRIAGHRRTVLRVYGSLVIAGFFTFLPGRLMAMWLLG